MSLERKMTFYYVMGNISPTPPNSPTPPTRPHTTSFPFTQSWRSLRHAVNCFALGICTQKTDDARSNTSRVGGKKYELLHRTFLALILKEVRNRWMYKAKFGCLVFAHRLVKVAFSHLILTIQLSSVTFKSCRILQAYTQHLIRSIMIIIMHIANSIEPW